MRSVRYVATAGVALGGLFLLGGCQVPADLLNPSVLTSLGFDSETINPPQGRTVVAFNNTSRAEALFSIVFFDPNLTDVASQNGAVGPGETSNSVLDCPIGAVIPAALGADAATPADVANAVLVATADGILAIPYGGVAIESGRDFSCGDVIEIRLVQIGQGETEEDFRIVVTVRAGR